MWSRIIYGKKDFPFNYSEFICDIESDIATLPTNKRSDTVKSEPCSIGSKAFVIETKSLYMLNNQNEWKLIRNISTSGDGGSANIDFATPEEFYEYLDI